ncbi:MAG: hypothetical protein LBJ11_07385 [Oscillospiraceae bacterium]|jgi:hypothetical protein|nr:hypothetical protein [Oscillospiraceae bacterium]
MARFGQSLRRHWAEAACFFSLLFATVFYRYALGTQNWQLLLPLPPVFFSFLLAARREIRPSVLFSGRTAARSAVLAGLAALSTVYFLRQRPLILVLALCAAGIGGFFFFQIFGAWLSGLRVFGQNGNRLAARTGVFAATLIPLGIDWLRTPGHFLSSVDVQYQWAQVSRTMPLNDVHALAHTLLLKALTFNGQISFASVTAVQILLLAVLCALFADYFAQKGADTRVLLGGFVLLALAMPAKTFLYPWKDGPYVLALGVVFYYLLRTLDREFTLTWKHVVPLGLALAGSGLFRYNGILPAAGCLLYFLGYGLRNRAVGGKVLRKLACAAAVAAICAVSVNGLGYRVFRAAHIPNGYGLQQIGSGLAAVAASATSTTGGDR